MRQVRRIIEVNAADRLHGPGHDRRLAWHYWALGQAARRMAEPHRQDAVDLAGHFVGCQPSDQLAVALMVVGADALLDQHPSSLEAATVLRRSAALLHRPRPAPDWCWPEPELDPIDALLPHALIAAGKRLAQGALVRSGLVLLDWRLDHNGSSDDPVRELAVSVAACARAFEATGNIAWARRATELASTLAIETPLRNRDACAWRLTRLLLDGLRGAEVTHEASGDGSHAAAGLVIVGR